MTTQCKHAASGCNYPEGECIGLCMDTRRTPGQRYDFEMSEPQLEALLAAMRPEPYIITTGGVGPRSQQENANDAWARLGDEMGFDGMTVRPNGKGDRFFSAIAKATSQKDTQ